LDKIIINLKKTNKKERKNSVAKAQLEDNVKISL